MVDLNFDRRRPPALLDLNGVAELAQWQRDGDTIRIGAARAVQPDHRRGRAARAGPRDRVADGRVAADPQPRHARRATSRTASPAGDALPPLVTMDAMVEIGSARGERSVPVREFFIGPKRNVLEPDELIRAVRVPVARGPQQFAKVGTRNAMVISVCSFALTLDTAARSARGCIGSAGPTVLPTPDAEEFLGENLPWGSGDPLDDVGRATLRRAGRRRRASDRRRARYGELPAARGVRARAPDVAVDLDRRRRA